MPVTLLMLSKRLSATIPAVPALLEPLRSVSSNEAITARGRWTPARPVSAAQVLQRICTIRGAPQSINVHNGSEFITKAMDRWAYESRVELDFSRPGKPTGNAHI